MSITTITQAREVIERKEPIDLGDSFQIAKICARALRNPAEEKIARDTVIRVLDDWEKFDPITKTLWNDIVEAFGLYPYLTPLTPGTLTGAALLRFEYHKSKNLEGVYFHEEQNDLAFKLLARKSVVLSAPTSFGKSLLIEELIASRKYQNIVIIQPTLALLDETRKKLQKYKNNYKTIVSTTQKPSEIIGNIFLFTGERVVEYPYFIRIDFFVIDEFYKLSLSRDDDRALVLNHAFYKLLRFTNKFYLLGPMIKSIPEALTEKYEADWIHSTFATVAIDEISYKQGQAKNKEQRKYELFNLLIDLNEPTLIYCAAPQTATDIAIEFVEFVIENNPEFAQLLKTSENNDLIEWLHENIHPSWSLLETLQYSTAFHHGAIPRHLGSSIVDSFNNDGIKYLFCTSTLIEGVNTTAKNVILFDKRKGPKPIDFFDYRNIAGRSGRMKIYYVGRVYKFHPEPVQMELDVDIPIITQSDAPLEILIQLEPDELSESSVERMSEIYNLGKELFGILKENSGIPIEGQINVVRAIEADLYRYNNLLCWQRLPKYTQLLTVIQLAWDYLLRKKESKASVRTPEHLTVITIQYLNLRSISAMINETLNQKFWKEKIPDIKERVDKLVFSILNNARHWFDYKLPKLLGTVSSLQQYVFKKHGLPYGDYNLTASMLENSFLPKNVATLIDLDIPFSALRKLQSAFVSVKLEEVEKILDIVASVDLSKYGLNSYEIKKIRKIL